LTTPHYQSFEGLLKAGGVLDRIIEAKSLRLSKAIQEKALENQAPVKRLESGSFSRALSRTDRVNIIAEIKHRSPSKGIIREDFDPISIAESYRRAGAAALSILTEEDFFNGSLDYLRAVRSVAPDLPLLRKDFIFHPYQVEESAAAGADAILLITATLSDQLLEQLIGLAGERGLDALVEVHTAKELERAARAGSRIIGVNNRDLRTFSVALETSLELAEAAPAGAILVSESGISTTEHIRRLSAAGFHAFLIGEHFMKAPDPGSTLAELLK
jgi:indole-3-glycerol phosphate synthase